MKEQCLNCKWYSPEFEHHRDMHTGDGLCVRHAPIPENQVRLEKPYIDERPYGLWPKVSVNHFCGDFEEREDEGIN